MTRPSTHRRGPFDPLAIACVGALVLRYPWLAIGLALPDVAGRYRKASSRRREKSRAEFDPLIVARVIQVGLAGGLPLTAALNLAVGEVGQLVAGELTATLRIARREGMSSAMATTNASYLRPLFSRIALARASGAPMHEAVSAYLTDGRAARRGKALEKVRRLPVALMVPLGLLILPGFVVLFVGPIVLNSLLDLSRSLP